MLVAESHFQQGKLIENLILGGQDGLVNVLGIILGVAAATSDSRIVIIAGLAATFAESISMGAVAFTSQKAGKQFYESEKARELKEIEEMPEQEKQEIREIFAKKGFKGKDLERVVEVISSDKKVWLETMMSDELKLSSYEATDPKQSAVVVGLSALVGSVLPLLPFFLFSVETAFVASIVFSVFILFVAGAIKAKFTIGSWKKSGMEMAAIGTLAAISGYVIGILLK